MRSPPLAPDLRVALPAAAFGAAAPPPSGTALARRVPVSREGGAAPRRGRSGTGGPPAKRAAGSARGEARGERVWAAAAAPPQPPSEGSAGVRCAARLGEGRGGMEGGEAPPRLAARGSDAAGWALEGVS